MLRAENSTVADARTEGLALEISRVNDAQSFGSSTCKDIQDMPGPEWGRPDAMVRVYHVLTSGVWTYFVLEGGEFVEVKKVVAQEAEMIASVWA